MEEALALIPAHAPEWTNHNASDPGITLIEMFAFLTEMLIYRLNRVTDANKLAFLKLLNPPDWTYDNTTPLNRIIQDTVLRLREEQRAVTLEDFQRLTLAADKANVAHAYCLPRCNLESGQPDAAIQEATGHVSIVILPAPDSTQKLQTIIDGIKKELEPCCLITTRLHVVAPSFLKIGIRISIKTYPDALEEEVQDAALKALNSYFNPLAGGVQGTGWPLGRNVYVSEIYALLDKLPGVDFVLKTLDNANNPMDELTSEDGQRRLLAQDGKQLVGIQLKPNELVDLQVKDTKIHVFRKAKN
jgi:hypothetical protein